MFCGRFPNGSICKWNDSEPDIRKVHKVADYLGVPIEKLLAEDEREVREDDHFLEMAFCRDFRRSHYPVINQRIIPEIMLTRTPEIKPMIRSFQISFWVR